jgi:EAL domain-containing protein (putative c-di-GMP-specific phosphodiesterase class I)
MQRFKGMSGPAPDRAKPEATGSVLPKAAAVPSTSRILDLVLGRRFGTEYQPVVDLRTGATLGHEALSRFFDEDGRVVPPGPVFHSLVEEPALLLHVEAETKRFQIECAPTGPLFLNVAPDSFRAQGSSGGLFEVLGGRCGAPVMVEVVETLTTGNPRLDDDTVAALRDRSIGIALDDIGAPGTLLSLDTIKEADVLKLDCSWLRRIGDPRERAIFDALVTLARRLGALTVLEGIETSADLDRAVALGVDAVQGFLFRPQFHLRLAA